MKRKTLGKSGTQYVAMVTKRLGYNCGARLLESFCQESNISDTNWLRCRFVIFGQNLVENMTSSLG